MNRQARSQLKGQRACVLWFTGLSGSGKSTIANLVEKRLHALGRHTYVLDGDNVRHGLNKDLGFTDADRVENIRRVGEVSKLMVDAGLIVLVSFISPFRSERRMARELLEPGEFLEVFIDTPLAEAEKRDPKGLYAKARAGELQELHRHRLALRAAGESGNHHRHHRRSRRNRRPSSSSPRSTRPISLAIRTAPPSPASDLLAVGREDRAAPDARSSRSMARTSNPAPRPTTRR